MSKVIFENRFYCVSLSPICGLVVEKQNIKQDKEDIVFCGLYMKPENPQFKEWKEAFETSISKEESHALAKAFLSGAV